MSKATFERRSAESPARVSSSIPLAAAHCGVKVCQVYDSRRGGSDYSTTCSGWAVSAPRSRHTTGDPVVQSVPNSSPQ